MRLDTRAMSRYTTTLIRRVLVDDSGAYVKDCRIRRLELLMVMHEALGLSAPPTGKCYMSVIR